MPMPTYLDVTKDSSDSETELNSKSTFRVSICLKRYFSDIRALSYVLISKKKTVKWLEKKIRKLFNVNEDFILTSRGHLLPSSERLGLLNADDIVEVIPNESHPNNKIKWAHAMINNSCNVENISIDVADSAADKNQIYFSRSTCGQKESLKELEQRTMESDQCPNEIECIQDISNNSAAVGFDVNVESEYKYTNKCDSDASAKKKKENHTHEQEEPLTVIKLKKGVESYISNGSNIHNLSTNEVEDQLEVMKRNALALLDSSISSCSDIFQNSSNIGGTRKRKRVRRKRQQVFVLEDVVEKNNDSFKKTLPHENEIKQKNSLTESSNTIPVVILHNEEISIRKPRFVQSIVESR